jgi:mannose-6-phosphate isomerase
MKETIKPWGKEKILEVNDKYVFKELEMKRGHSCSLQYHEKKIETIYVLKGFMELQLEDENKVLQRSFLKSGDVQHIESGRIHRMTAVSDIKYLEASTPELEDVVRVEDLYGRK